MRIKNNKHVPNKCPLCVCTCCCLLLLRSSCISVVSTNCTICRQKLGFSFLSAGAERHSLEKRSLEMFLLNQSNSIWTIKTATYGQCNTQHKCICKAHLKNNVLRKGGMDISKKPQDTQWGIRLKWQWVLIDLMKGANLAARGTTFHSLSLNRGGGALPGF